MKRSMLLSLILFGLGLLIGIYPSFVSKPGFDCVAGCVVGKGFPFPFLFSQVGGVVEESAVTTIQFGSFSLDILLLLVITLLPQLIPLFAPRKLSEKE